MDSRDTIFISHATPADNEFSIWLASRLEMLGFKVWLDKKQLMGGERFWPTIQKAIQRSQKVLLVYSKNIVSSEGILRQGIDDEISYAKEQAYQFNLKDFIIPLHLDDSSYGLVIGMPNINHISFNQDWALGLGILLKKLEKDNILPGQIKNFTFSNWYEQNYVSEIRIEKRNQVYYSTWLPLGNVPDNFYIYKFRTEDEAIVIRNLNDSFPINRNSNILATFEPNLNLTIQSTDNFFPIETLLPEIYEVNISDLLIQEGKGYENKKFPSLIDKRNALRRLLLSVWNQLLKEKGLLVYEMSGKRYAYYQPIYNGIHRNINLNCKTRYNRTRRKQITGKFKDYFWHYALSTRILTSPILGYDLKSHIVFTKDGKDYINDTKIQHRLRRAKGKNMFNKAWRDLLLAYIQNLKGEDNKIICNVGYNGLYVELKDCTLMFKCDYDYLDPNTPMSEYNIEGVYIEEFDEEYE